MDTKVVYPGKRAPEGWDVIRVERSAGDQFSAFGKVAHADGATFTQEGFSTELEAQEAAMAWARRQGCAIVYLERPLPE